MAFCTDDDPHSFQQTFEELFSQQPPSMQSFLLYSAQLERFTAGLCDTILDQQESQKVLLELEQNNRFLIPLDTTHTWYRYHKLFGDFLRAHLQQTEPETLPIILHKAARWYEQQGNPVQSITYLLAAGELQAASKLLERSSELLMKDGEFLTLQHFFTALPEEVLSLRPRLFLYYAVCMVMIGRVQEAYSYLHKAEQTLLPWLEQKDALTTNTTNLLQIETPPEQVRCELYITQASLAAFQGKIAETMQLTSLAIPLLPPGNDFLRSTLLGSQATAYILHGDLTGGAKDLLEAQDAGRAIDYHYLETVSKSIRAYMLMEQVLFSKLPLLASISSPRSIMDPPSRTRSQP